MSKENVRNNARQLIIQSAFQLFRKEGYSRVSVDAIAANANVTKRTVYYHFKSKDEILTDVLDNQHITDLANFESWVSNQQETAEEFVGVLFEQLQVWSESPDWLGSGFTRVAMELAHLRGHPAVAATRRYKCAIETWITSQLERRQIEENEHLARQLFILIEGSMCLTLIHKDISYIEVAANAAKVLTRSTR